MTPSPPKCQTRAPLSPPCPTSSTRCAQLSSTEHKEHNSFSCRHLQPALITSYIRVFTLFCPKMQLWCPKVRGSPSFLSKCCIWLLEIKMQIAVATLSHSSLIKTILSFKKQVTQSDTNPDGSFHHWMKRLKIVSSLWRFSALN